MIIQVALPSDNSRCLRFRWREDLEQRTKVDEYLRQVLRAKRQELRVA